MMKSSSPARGIRESDPGFVMFEKFLKTIAGPRIVNSYTPRTGRKSASKPNKKSDAS